MRFGLYVSEISCSRALRANSMKREFCIKTRNNTSGAMGIKSSTRPLFCRMQPEPVRAPPQNLFSNSFLMWCCVKSNFGSRSRLRAFNFGQSWIEWQFAVRRVEKFRQTPIFIQRLHSKYSFCKIFNLIKEDSYFVCYGLIKSNLSCIFGEVTF